MGQKREELKQAYKEEILTGEPGDVLSDEAVVGRILKTNPATPIPELIQRLQHSHRYVEEPTDTIELLRKVAAQERGYK